MSKSDLVKYAWQSSIMDVSIVYGDEKFKFNLNSEILIDENRINAEIKDQPSAYAFLSMLHKKLIRTALDKKKEMEKAYSKKFIYFRGQIDETTNRPMANELVKEKTNASASYQLALDEYHKALDDANVIETCVKAFEQRKDLIQTLSANIRKE